MILKNQIGNGYLEYRAPSCYKNTKKIVHCDNITFNNTMGTCWMISIFTIFLSSDSTSKCVQHILRNKKTDDIFSNIHKNKLLAYILPTDVFFRPRIIRLLEYIKEKFNIKFEDERNDPNYNPSAVPDPIAYGLRRQDSVRTEELFAEIIYSLFDKILTSDEYGRYRYGTFTDDNFFIINILSCLLLRKLISFNIFKLNIKIDKKLLKNTIGILINMHGHVCSFYICQNNMKFCNNNRIINYNWIKLFNVCNALTESKKIYSIYLDFTLISPERGPFIYIDNKMIYFDTIQVTEEENTSNIKFSDNKDYLNITSFIFLTYYNDVSTFKKSNSIYYSRYYARLDKFEEYQKFINKYNINSTDLNQYVEDPIELPLFIACYYGSINIVTLLLRYQIDINQLTKDGITPLHIACQNGCIEIVRLLLDQPEIKVKQLTKDGRSALFIACHEGDTEIVTLLLDKTEIEFNQLTDNGTSALYIVCQNGHTEIVRLLLDKTGIEFNQLTDNGISALYIACQNGHIEIVHLLLDKTGIKVNQLTKDGRSALYIACHKGHIEIVRLLLDKTGIEVNQLTKNGRSALYIACQNGHTEIVRLLLDKTGIEFNQQDDNGETSLYIACREGHIEIVRLLLDKTGIEVNHQDNDEETSLYIACREGHIEIVRLLLDKTGIEVNQLTDNGTSALYIACHKGHTEIVRLLLDKTGIEFNQLNDTGRSALYIACHKGHTEIVRLLLDKTGIEFNQQDNDGETSLYIACQNGHTEIVRLLLDKTGIEVHKLTNDGISALSIAQQKGYSDIVTLLQHL